MARRSEQDLQGQPANHIQRNPGVSFRAKDDRHFSLYVSPLGNLDALGHVRLRVSPGRERGIESWERLVVSEVDVARARMVMELVMATHFPANR